MEDLQAKLDGLDHADPRSANTTGSALPQECQKVLVAHVDRTNTAWLVKDMLVYGILRLPKI